MMAKKAKFSPLAPVEAEIPVRRCSAHKIAAKNENDISKNAQSFCSKFFKRRPFIGR